MAELDFPASPTNGQVYTANGKTWTYSTAAGAWLSSGTGGSVSSVTSVAGRTGDVTLSISDIQGLAIGSTVQAWDADLDAIAGLQGTAGYLRKTAANTWTLDTGVTGGGGGGGGGGDLDADLVAIAALAGTSGILRKTALNTWALDTATYLTGNQSITLSGDVSASGTITTPVSVTISSATITGKQLTGYTVGTNTALSASDTILQAFGKLQAQVSAAGGGGTLTGSGTTNYLSKFAAGTSIGNSQIFDNGTSVGVGTASPSASARLDVNGTVQATGYSGLTSAIVYVIDGGGSAITTGVKGDLVIPFGCTVSEWSLVADQTGSITVDIWRDTFGNYPPTVADTITGSALPTISSSNRNSSTVLTGWSTSIASGSTLRFNVNSASAITRATLTLRVVRTA